MKGRRGERGRCPGCQRQISGYVPTIRFGQERVLEAHRVKTAKELSHHLPSATVCPYSEQTVLLKEGVWTRESC